MRIKRNINIDIIKTLAVIFVIAVHSLLANNFYYSEIRNIESIILLFIRGIFIMCVPLFLVSTGYLMSKKELNKNYYKGILKVLLLYLIITVACMLFKSYYFHDIFNLKNLIKGLVNFDGASYAWYVEMYIGLFMIIPFLNIIINNLKDKKQHKYLIITCITLTSLPALLTRNNLTLFPDWWTNIYPITYYFIGAYFKKYETKNCTKHDLGWLIYFLILNFLANLYISYGQNFIWAPINDYRSLGIVLTTFYLFRILINFKTDKYPNILVNFFERASKYSLSIYLLSYIFDQIVYNKLSIISYNKIFLTICGIPIIFFLSFISAMILEELYDKFLKSKVNRLYDLVVSKI